MKETSLAAKGITRSRTRNERPSPIWTVAMSSSQSARALASSPPVGGNQDGKRTGRSPIPEPIVTNKKALMALTFLIGR
jgi:hypothetical protein